MRLLLCLYVLAGTCQVFGSDSIRILYCANKDIFEVSSFENGLPVLDTKLDAVDVEWEEREHGEWKVLGNLALKPNYALPSLNYSIKRVYRRSKSESDSPYAKVVHDGIGKDLEFWKSRGLSNLTMIMAWILDGEIRNLEVVKPGLGLYSSKLRELTISKEEIGGTLFVWCINSKRELLTKDRKNVSELVAFGSDSDIAVKKMVRDSSEKAQRKALNYAAALGYVEFAEWLLNECGVNPSKYGEKDVTPAHYAAKNGRLEVLSLLLEAKSKIKVRDDRLMYPMNYAADNGHLDCLKALVLKKPKTQEERFQYIRALNSSINKGYEQQALHLLEIGTSYNIESSERGRFVLKLFADRMPTLAEAFATKHKVKWLYHHNGYSILHAVASYADVELLDRLKAEGIPIWRETDKGIRPLDVAIGFGNVTAICWFLDQDEKVIAEESKIDLLGYAIQKGQRESVDCLLDYGFDANREVADTISPLMQATLLGEHGIARALQEVGGEWNLDSPYFETCVEKVIKMDALDLLKGILERGWDQERLLFGSMSMRDVATFHGSDGVLEFLDTKSKTTSDLRVISAKNLDEKPRLLERVKVDYNLEMQRKYGSRNVGLSVTIDSDGIPRLVKFKGKEPVELATAIENAVSRWRFSPGIKAGKAVPVSMAFKLPLVAAMDPENVFEMVALTDPPKALNQVHPYYPYYLMESRIEGWVVVEFVIADSGVVIDAKPVKSSHFEFEPSAVQSIYRSKWQPGEANGKPVNVRVRQKILFTLR